VAVPSDIVVDSASRPVVAALISRAYVGNFHVPTDIGVSRLSPDGSPDSSFADNGLADFAFPDIGHPDSVAVALDARGRIYVAATMRSDSAARAALLVARLTDTGALDPAFGGGDGYAVTDLGAVPVDAPALGIDLLIDGSGRPVVGGDVGGDLYVARFDATTGAPDPSFGGGAGLTKINVQSVSADDRIGGVALDGIGRIVVGATTVVGSHTPAFAAVRLTKDGSLDTSFNAASATPGRQIDFMSPGQAAASPSSVARLVSARSACALATFSALARSSDRITSASAAGSDVAI